MKLKKLRKEIDKITKEIIKLIAKREKTVQKIGKIKKSAKLKIIDQKREEEILKKAEKISRKFGTNPKLIKK